jgi:hypothetical protein
MVIDRCCKSGTKKEPLTLGVFGYQEISSKISYDPSEHDDVGIRD